MRSRFGLVSALLAALPPGAARPGSGESVIAAFAVQDRSGDSGAAAVLDEALRLELGERGRLVGREETRDAQRRLRLRNGDRAPAAQLHRLGTELRADWLVSATLHDTDRRLVPSLAVSVRVYSGETGELAFTTFRGGSGLDGRTLLGLGTIGDLESLVPVVVRDLVSELPAELAPASPGGELRAALGTLAIVPFSGSTEWRATPNAETVTEAARARLFGEGIVLVSPNDTYEILRRLQAGAWGGVTAETRAALRETAGADTILTGTVESYETGGSESEPDPRVAVAVRLVDAASGRILWTGSSEREGWDRQGLFRRGRIYSRGALTERIMKTLITRLERDGPRGVRESGERR